MWLEAIISEGERLVRPSLWLTETPSETGVVAYWGGQGRVGVVGREDDRHRITFDCTWLAAHGFRLRGSVGVYDVDPHWRWRTPIWLDRVPAPLAELQMQGGIALFGLEVLSVPPLEAVCLYGGPVVEEWLASENLERIDYDAAATTAVGEAYRQEYEKRCPLFSDSPAAVLGGWHAIWSDDEFYLPREMRLMLWTFRDAEPWIEVFERLPNFPIRIRIT